MIDESWLWKKDLKKISERLQKRIHQKRWMEITFEHNQKDIMIAGFMIRKLVESNKISDKLKGSSIPITEIASNGKPVEHHFAHLKPFKYFDFENTKKSSISVMRLCDYLIHSYYFDVAFTEEKVLDVLWVASDRSKTKCLSEIKIVDFIKLLNKITEEEFLKISSEFIDGKPVVKVW
jgi:hypothetical protein